MTNSPNSTNLRGFPPAPGVSSTSQRRLRLCRKNHSRRAVLAGIATAPAPAAPALAYQAGDARLRELWSQYLEDVATERGAHAAFALAHIAHKAIGRYSRYAIFLR
jgi:hypothetical protein